MVGIRISATTNFGALDRVSRLVDAYPDELQEAVYDVAVAENDNVIKPLRQTPPKVTGRRDWQTPLQRTAYHASGGFGRGIPSTRTGQMNDAWALGFLVQKGSIAVTLYNTSGHFRFVVGGLRLSDPPTQQRMFAQGGYKLVAPIIVDESERFTAKVIKRIRLIPREFK